jgi:hypothetical protein
LFKKPFLNHHPGAHHEMGHPSCPGGVIARFQALTTYATFFVDPCGSMMYFLAAP